MRSLLPGLRLRPLHGLAVIALLSSLSSAQANTVQQPAQPISTSSSQPTLSSLPEAPSRNLTCEALLETAGYQQAALQSVVERRAVALETSQEATELERIVQESQARLDQTQGQINSACAA